jgi:hypothetical protein
MNALRNEINDTVFNTVKDKLRLDVDSISTISHTISALEANTEYWGELSLKSAHRER